jgi:hypothetical protein
MVARVFATVQEKEKHKTAEVEISGRVPRPAGVVTLGGSGAESDNTEQSGNWKGGGKRGLRLPAAQARSHQHKAVSTRCLTE